MKKHNLQIIESTTFAESYYKTLSIWYNNLSESISKIKKLGYTDELIRKWQFYLAYCAAGFYTKRTNVVQYFLKHKDEK